MNVSKVNFKFPWTSVHDAEDDYQLPCGPESPLKGRSGNVPHKRRESQFRAVAETMNTTIAGHHIRTWSAYFYIILAINLALYIGIAKQDMRKNLYVANSSLADSSLLYITFVAFVLPLVCRFFLRLLAASVAGALLSRQAYSAPAACALLAIHLQTTPNIRQNLLVFRADGVGVRDVLIIRFIGDYVVHFTAPFVTLSLFIRSAHDQCWMSFDWGWLFFVVLWPSLWSVAATLYMARYWQCQECTRSFAFAEMPSVSQAAKDLKWVTNDEDEHLPAEKWRLGYRIKQDHESSVIDQTYLGLLREDECISMTDMLSAMEQDDGTLGGRLPQDV
ncbi:hypothetical protein BKA63DRAFT_484851 [Paraphoma chrysanthemicola]|nr:hypothetical protein BKA63DRAFT_484851 [Paraphoma chrysanthemicola]